MDAPYIKEIKTGKDLEMMCRCEKAIIYMQVDWSGPERAARKLIFTTLERFQTSEISLFKIDCSDQENEDVIGWLVKQKEQFIHLYVGGWGETLLVQKGQIVDVVHPNKLGFINTENKLIEWLTHTFTSTDNLERINLAKKSLKGVSIGDAFGDSFFGETDEIEQHINLRTLPHTKWEFTDDTVMSIAVLEELEQHADIKHESLLQKFCRNLELDPNRGYGATVRRVLREIAEGGDWKMIAGNVFDGQGSMGNGAAMRVCPIGAFYFDDLEKVKKLALKSAEVTHANIEAKVGAIAVAIATALAAQAKLNNTYPSPIAFMENIVCHLPDSDTKSKIVKAITVPYSYYIETVKTILGNGNKMLAQDTVPFSIWCAAYNLNNFEEALWKAISILGDRDTICAIVGGITIMSSADNNIPVHWLDMVEDTESSIFRSKTA